jgi:GTP cyclohydrolase I
MPKDGYIRPRFNIVNSDDVSVVRMKESLRLFMHAIAGPMDADQLRSTEDTPMRFIKSLVEQTAGYEEDPEKILTTIFDQQFDEMIVVKNIDFNSLCEHHLLPFIGKATVGYIPNGGVVGLSKIPRLVDCYARRLQLQERMAVEIADALEKHLKPIGVGVILEAQHQCMSCRGVKKQNASMVTSVLRGRIKEDEKARAEFLQFINH